VGLREKRKGNAKTGKGTVKNGWEGGDGTRKKVSTEVPSSGMSLKSKLLISTEKRGKKKKRGESETNRGNGDGTKKKS